MKTLIERLELLASHCSSVEQYKESLFVLSYHCSLIQSAKNSEDPRRQLGLLHDLYKSTSECSLDTRDKIMYSISRRITYYTSIEILSPVADPIGIRYTIANAILHIEDQRNKLKS